MKTGMTFRSDDEYWAWVDRQIRMRERLCKAARYLAVMAAGVFLMFALLYVFARSMRGGRYDPWREAINTVRSQSG